MAIQRCAPWGAWNDGEGIRSREIANKLRPYEVGSHDLRTDQGTKKGYRRADFRDAWTRYLPALPDSKHDIRDIGFPEPKTPLTPGATAPAPSRIDNGQTALGSVIHESGQKSGRQLSDWLGHADPAFTQRVCVGQLDSGLGGAEFLDELIPVEGWATNGQHPARRQPQNGNGMPGTKPPISGENAEQPQTPAEPLADS
jgi:Protein of unknown function (DUF3631)